MIFHNFHRIFNNPDFDKNPFRHTILILRQEVRTVLVGRYLHAIDQKGRVIVPAKLRAQLGETFVVAAVLDRCITVYSMDEWDKLQGKLAEMPISKARKLQRYLSSNADEATVDAQGRILVPKHLLAYAGIEGEALFTGAGNRAEIWNPASYEQSMSDMTADEVEAEFTELGF